MHRRGQEFLLGFQERPPIARCHSQLWMGSVIRCGCALRSAPPVASQARRTCWRPFRRHLVPESQGPTLVYGRVNGTPAKLELVDPAPFWLPHCWVLGPLWDESKAVMAPVLQSAWGSERFEPRVPDLVVGSAEAPVVLMLFCLHAQSLLLQHENLPPQHQNPRRG